MNSRLLRARMIMEDVGIGQFAKAIGKAHQTASLKISGRVAFTFPEMMTLAKLLNLSLEDVNNIFFDGNLPKRNQKEA